MSFTEIDLVLSPAMYCVISFVVVIVILILPCRIYIVHDEVKDKAFELELSWIGEHTKGRHERAPKDVFTEAEAYAKAALDEESDSDLDE